MKQDSIEHNKNTSLPTRGSHFRIETDRYSLATMVPDNAPMLARWLSDPRVSAGLGEKPALRSEGQMATYISAFDRRTSYLFGIHERGGEKLLGFYAVHVAPTHASATITLVIGEEHELRRAAAIETARALASWAFGSRGLEKLSARVVETNTVSADWLGSRMTLEGRLRAELAMPDGSRADVLVFGLLRTEWDALKRWSIENQELKHSGVGR